MTEPITLAAVAMAAVSNVATWLVIIKSKNGSKQLNGHEKRPCTEHDKRLALIETNEKNRDKVIDRFMVENREDHQRIISLFGAK
jgi:hypothetical protein